MSSSSFIQLTSGRARAPEGLEGYTAVFPWAQGSLDQIAKEIGVTTPSQFVYADASDYQEMFDDEVPNDLKRQLNRQSEWHEAADGIRTFAAILAYVENNPKAVHTLIGEHNDLESVKLTVDVMHQVLQAASKQGERFRIQHEF